MFNPQYQKSKYNGKHLHEDFPRKTELIVELLTRYSLYGPTVAGEAGSLVAARSVRLDAPAVPTWHWKTEESWRAAKEASEGMSHLHDRWPCQQVWRQAGKKQSFLLPSSFDLGYCPHLGSVSPSTGQEKSPTGVPSGLFLVGFKSSQVDNQD